MLMKGLPLGPKSAVEITANFSSFPQIRTQAPNAVQDTTQDAMQMTLCPPLILIWFSNMAKLRSWRKEHVLDSLEIKQDTVLEKFCLLLLATESDRHCNTL